MSEEEIKRLEEALEKDIEDSTSVDLGEFVSNVEDVVAGLVEGEVALHDEIEKAHVNVFTELGSANMRLAALEARVHEQSALLFALMNGFINTRATEPVTVIRSLSAEKYYVVRRRDGAEWELDLPTLLKKLGG
jgi:hypothetical protein